MIDIYPRFSALIRQVVAKDGHTIKEGMIPYLNDQFYYDLMCWYHIAWLGHSLKQRKDVQELISHGRFFDQDKRNALMEIMAEQFDNLIDRYRILADNNQIELSMSPYSHPIIPLLIDINSMKDAQPDAPMPSYDSYPGGLERARWHIQHGIDVFEHFFKRKPKGVWLSEGAVSSDSIALLEEYDFTWTATGEGVWGRSRNASGFDTSSEGERHTLFHSHQLPDHPTRLFFRDDGLADMIGFEYKDWIAEDASKNFIHNIETIADFLPEPLENHVVSVILDGENAWEYYPDNAFHFLGSLYENLAEAERINLITFDEASSCCSSHQLPKLCAGSWVYGSFSTWIGEHDKNRGWDRLIEAKRCYDEVIASNTLNEQEQHTAMMQLAICEGSDWFWWFGDYNPSGSVRDFDDLYRNQLSKLYELLKQPIPEILNEPISSGGGAAENAGTMRRGEHH
jgi:alpha-amylase/alpha-mannosidase (GH57 family)